MLNSMMDQLKVSFNIHYMFLDGMRHGTGIYHFLVNPFKLVTDWTNDKIVYNIYKGDFLGKFLYLHILTVFIRGSKSWKSNCKIS